MTDHQGLAGALVAFQASLPRLRKTTSGQVPGKRDYKYADLADVNFDVLTELAKHGLCWMCGPNRADDGAPVLRWKLLHTSGEFETGDYELPRDATPQQMGSAITYGRRYCVTAVTGVVPDGDDDGAAASSAQARPPQQRNNRNGQQVAPTTEPAQEAHLVSKAKLRKACAASGWDMHKVANLFAGQNKAELGDTTNADLIDKFTASLYALPDSDLKAPEKASA